MKIKKMIECPDCEGSGTNRDGWCGDYECCDLLDCSRCNGEGEIEEEE